MGIGTLVGRLLLAAIFLGAGLSKIKDQKESSAFLSDNYRKFHDWVLYDLGLDSVVGRYEPELLLPKGISAHSKEIILYTGYFEVGVAALIVAGVGFGGWLAGNFVLLATAIFHNPFLSKDKSEYTQQTYFLLANFAIIGGCFLVGSSHIFARGTKKTVPPSTEQSLPGGNKVQIEQTKKP
jgi:uncharacterized membrane protein YphA (DoxX/SURF4 family)